MSTRKDISSTMTFSEIQAQAKAAGRSVAEFLEDNKLSFADSMGGYAAGTMREFHVLAQVAGKTVEEFLKDNGLRLPTLAEATDAYKKSRTPEADSGEGWYWSSTDRHFFDTPVSVKTVRQQLYTPKA